MAHWRYRITVHAADDVLEALSEPVEEVPRMIYCDDEGACYFDNGPNPLTQAIERLLNQVGEEGWELVQVAFRPEQMICFWKEPR
jgi:hypothetical protein